MKIAQIITRSDSVGGAHIHLRDLCLQLINDGHEVTVLVGGEGPFTDELSACRIPHSSLRHLVRPIRAATDTRAILELRRTLQRLQPDVVATHSSKAGLVGRLAARSLRLPVVFTAHGWAFTEGVANAHRRIYTIAERFASRFTDRIITVSDYDRSLALAAKIAPEDKLITVHNGVLPVHHDLRARPAEQPPRIVMVARFEHPKDHRTLIAALGQIRELPWHLELIGDGPLRKETEQFAASLGLHARIDFVGARDDIAQRLASAHILALISRWEGLPLTVLEGMRAALPVVASDVGGVREAVRHGETGYVVPRSNVDALAGKLKKLIETPAMRHQMGQFGLELYESQFAFQSMYEKTVQVYEDVSQPTMRKRNR